MAILGAEGSGKGGDNPLDFLERHHVQLLWLPSLSSESPQEVAGMIERMLAGEQELRLLCVEGTIIHVPHGTGMFDTFAGKPKRDIIRAIWDTADYALAMGTCAAFDGLPGPGLAHRRSLESTIARPGSAFDRWLPLLNSFSPPN
jgi:Ni,Fe-hydrogenase I small subunit